ncbi:MAG: hypothetical protein CVU11_03550 [Bacteroidetes bacterium HGW-Bacteroidetes-6]|jgi:F0F1-type ATP synthase assembly protein I|nr:MAG: hypothetical protein CVU11_03550 [Bacteroidetes bacterium HGW-Bacteroidetes-6]
MPKQSKDPRKQGADFARYSGLAFEMMVIIGGGTWGAVWLDDYLGNSTPWFTITIAPLSVVVAMYLIIKDLNRNK